MQDRTPFVYIVGWPASNLYYIGSRYCKGCSPDDLGTRYFTSSKTARAIWAYIPPPLCKVIKTFDTAQAAYEYEQLLLRHLNVLDNPKYLNKCINGKKFAKYDFTLEHRTKLSAKKKGHSPWNKGKKYSQEQIAKLNMSGLDKGRATAKGRQSRYKGVPRSEETKLKISEAKKGKPNPNKGRPRSPETIAKMIALASRADYKEKHTRAVREFAKRNKQSKAVHTPEGQFYSIGEACRRLNIGWDTFKLRMKKFPDQYYYLPKPE